MMACCTVVLIASLALDTGVRSLRLASVVRGGPPPMPLRFSSAAQDRKNYPDDSPSEPSYDFTGDDDGDDGDVEDDDDDDGDLSNTGDDDSSTEDREDQLDQDDPGNFRDSRFIVFKKAIACSAVYRFVCYTTTYSVYI